MGRRGKKQGERGKIPKPPGFLGFLTQSDGNTWSLAPLYPNTSQLVPPAPNRLSEVVLCCWAIDTISLRGDNKLVAPVPTMLGMCRQRCSGLPSCPVEHILKHFWPRSFSLNSTFPKPINLRH